MCEIILSCFQCLLLSCTVICEPLRYLKHLNSILHNSGWWHAENHQPHVSLFILGYNKNSGAKIALSNLKFNFYVAWGLRCYTTLQPRLEMNLLYADADREKCSRLLTRHKLVELLPIQQQQWNVHSPLAFWRKGVRFQGRRREEEN